MNENRNQQVMMDPQRATPKKSYHTPQLKNFGSISALTKTNSSSGSTDSGSFPNSYAS